MSEELQVAFEQMAERGRKAGASTVASRSLAEVLRSPTPDAKRRRSFVAVGALVAAVAVVAAGAVVLRSRLPEVRRVNVGASLGNGSTTPGVMTLLVVGTDSDRRADAVMLVRVDRSNGALSVLSMPRDLHVPTAGNGPHTRLASTSASQLIATVRAMTMIPIDHFVEFDWAGFKNVVDAVGGVDLHVPERIRDRLSGLDLPAGCNHLDGDSALAYVRARHVETQNRSDGGFSVDPSGDLGRIARQQALLVVALDQLTRTRDVGRIERIADAVAENVRVDDSFSFRDVAGFATAWARRDGPRHVATYPTTVGTLDTGAVVLRPDDAHVPDVIAGFTAPENAPPSMTAEISCDR